MRTLYLLASAVFTTVLVMGCGSKQKADTQTPDQANPGAVKERAPKVAKTERASGELREALLHLRRVHFGYDTATLLPEARSALQEAAERLQAHPDVHVYIDGHTDDRGTTEYNLGLGDNRARTVSDYLTRLGIAPERLHVITFGKEHPWAKGSSEIDNAKNRRAEFRLMRGDVALVLDDGVLYDDHGKMLASPPK